MYKLYNFWDGIKFGKSSYTKQFWAYWEKDINGKHRQSGGRTGEVLVEDDYDWHFICMTLDKDTGTMRYSYYTKYYDEKEKNYRVYRDNKLISILSSQYNFKSSEPNDLWHTTDEEFRIGRSTESSGQVTNLGSYESFVIF